MLFISVHRGIQLVTYAEKSDTTVVLSIPCRKPLFCADWKKSQERRSRGHHLANRLIRLVGVWAKRVVGLLCGDISRVESASSHLEPTESDTLTPLYSFLHTYAYSLGEVLRVVLVRSVHEHTPRQTLAASGCWNGSAWLSWAA